jgi:hypothetical protein
MILRFTAWHRPAFSTARGPLGTLGWIVPSKSSIGKETMMSVWTCTYGTLASYMLTPAPSKLDTVDNRTSNVAVHGWIARSRWCMEDCRVGIRTKTYVAGEGLGNSAHALFRRRECAIQPVAVFNACIRSSSGPAISRGIQRRIRTPRWTSGSDTLWFGCSGFSEPAVCASNEPCCAHRSFVTISWILREPTYS